MRQKNTNSNETNKLKIENIDHVENIGSTNEQPLVMSSQNENSDTTYMCPERCKGIDRDQLGCFCGGKINFVCFSHHQ